MKTLNHLVSHNMLIHFCSIMILQLIIEWLVFITLFKFIRKFLEIIKDLGDLPKHGGASNQYLFLLMIKGKYSNH